MQLIVWNSQGDEWDMLWNYFLYPHVQNAQLDDVAALIVEAGWAPWINSDLPVNVDVVHNLKGEGSRQDPDAVLRSAFCDGMSNARNRQAYWVPWVQTFADVQTGQKSNSRCSMGAVVLPRRLRHGDAKRFVDTRFVRPIIQVPFGESVGGTMDVSMTVMGVHLVSSVNALQELEYLFHFVPGNIPGGTPAFVAGDFNIDMIHGWQPGWPALPRGWQVVSPGVATRRSGKILDWALVYNRTGDPVHAAVQVLQGYESGVNRSDHSVLEYTLTW